MAYLQKGPSILNTFPDSLQAREGTNGDREESGNFGQHRAAVVLGEGMR